MASWQYPSSLSLTASGRIVDASVRLPGSKSITNRALLLAALADGESELVDPLHSEDTLYMAQALRDLGVEIEEQENGNLVVSGRGGRFAAPSNPLFIGNSGTTIRFLTAAAALAPEGAEVVLDGIPRMRERPIRDLLDGLRGLGVDAVDMLGTGCPPVRVRGGGIAGGRTVLNGGISSQYLSAILQVAPCAQADVEIEIAGDLISKPYVEITRSVMRSFGAKMENDEYRVLRVQSGQAYVPCRYDVEADASNASYFLAAAALTGGRVVLENLGSDSIQGDAAFVDVLRQMGCEVTDGLSIALAGPERLRAVDVDMTAIPDTAQTLAVLCAFADGPSQVRGLGSLRVKETDRITAVATELRKIGAEVEESPDSWTIRPAADGGRAAAIDTYDDHRMAMAFAVASLRIPGLVINDPGCVAKTFPDFWSRWPNAFSVTVQA